MSTTRGSHEMVVDENSVTQLSIDRMPAGGFVNEVTARGNYR